MGTCFVCRARRSEDGQSTASANGDKLNSLPVSFEDVKPKNCAICGCTSHDASPFDGATDGDCYGGKRPWKRYVRSAIMPDHKEPASRLCLLCCIVFQVSVFAAKYKSIKNYLTFLSGKPEENQPFLRLVKVLISKVNGEVGGYVLALKQVKVGSITTVEEENRSGRRCLVRFTFVVSSVYQELYADKSEYAMRFGELDQNADINDAILSGFWTRGDFNSHLDGHFLVEDYNDKNVAIVSKRETGDMILSGGQAVEKFNAIKDSNKAVAPKTRKMSTSDMLSMMAARYTPTREDATTAKQAVGGGGGDDEAAQDDSDEADENCDDDMAKDLRGSLSDTLASGKTKAHPKDQASAKAKAPPIKPSPGTKPSSAASGGARASSALSCRQKSSIVESGEQADASEVVVVLSEDGRAKRVVMGVKKDLDDLRSLANCLNMEFIDDIEHPLGKGLQFQASLRTAGKTFAKHLASCTALERRCTMSKAGTVLLEELKEIHRLQHAFEVGKHLVATLGSSKASASEILDATRTNSGGYIKLSYTMKVMVWHADVESALMFGDYQQACCLLGKNAQKARFPEMQGDAGSSELSPSGSTTMQLSKKITEDVFIRQLQKIKQADFSLALAESLPRQLVHDFSNAFRAAREACDAGVADLPDVDEKTLATLVAPQLHPLDVVEITIIKLEEAKGLPASDKELLDPLTLHIVTHDSGALLMANCRSYVDKNAAKLKQRRLVIFFEAGALELLVEKHPLAPSYCEDTCKDKLVDMKAALADLSKMGKDGKQCAAKMQADMSDGVVRLASEIGKHRIAAAHEAAAAWARGDSTEAPRQSEDALVETLEPFVEAGFVEKNRLVELDKAFDHSCHLCMFLGFVARPTVEAPPSDVELAHVHQQEGAFASYPPDRLQEAMGLLGAGGLREWKEAGGPWKQFYDGLCSQVETRRLVAQADIREGFAKLANQYRVGANLKDLSSELQPKIALLLEDVQPPLNAMLEALATCESIKKLNERLSSESPFARAGFNKRDLNTLLTTLQKHVNAISKGKDALKNFEPFNAIVLAAAAVVVEEATSKHSEEDARALVKSLTDADVLIKKVPDIEKQESKFLAYMRAHGTKLNDALKVVEKAASKLTAVLSAGGADVKHESLDKSEVVKHQILNCITLYTFVLLLRSPHIASEKSVDDRSMVKDLYADFAADDTELFCPEAYLDEAKQILGIAESGEAATVVQQPTSRKRGAEGEESAPSVASSSKEPMPGAPAPKRARGRGRGAA